MSAHETDLRRYRWVWAVLMICGSGAVIQQTWWLLAVVIAVPVLGVVAAVLISRAGDTDHRRRPPT